MTKNKIHECLMTLLIVVCIVVATWVSGWSIPSNAYAESDDIQTRYEQTNVMSNLKGSTIAGKAFDVKDYPHNANAKPQIISFVEFCYSYYAEKQDDYGLYIYVYNPQDVAFDANTLRNKIQLTYGNKPSYKKYRLTFLNYSNDAGIEGRFYKFKIELTEAERADILKTLSPDERVYKVSGMELSVKNKVTEHTTAQTYTYKGFAVGYGSELAETDTLSCKVDGFDKYISLDVRSTYWRPDGTHEDLHSRDTLHSVYFAVPNSQEAREFEFVKDWAIARGTFGNYSELDTNAYIAQMWVQLDFDIIDLTFTKDNVATIIPVVMNPIDIAADADAPVYTTDDIKGLSWWQILLAILLVILIIFLLWKFAPSILTVMIKIILFPFKLIGMVFKSISSATNPMREKNKLRRQERKAQRKLESEQRKEQERQRKAHEKQKRREEKLKRKEQKRKSKRTWKLRDQERKRQEKQQKKEDKFYKKQYRKVQRKRQKQLRHKDPKKLTLADLDNLSDDVLAELYYEEYGDEEFGYSYDFNDELPF